MTNLCCILDRTWPAGLGLALLWWGSAEMAGASPVTRSFTSKIPIEILDDGPAEPYPSVIEVSGMPGVLTEVSVTLWGLSHSYPDDVDIVLVTPSGQKLMLMSDAGGSFPFGDLNLTFRDGFPAIPNGSQLVTATYAPGNYGIADDAFDSPAPPGPYSVGLTNAIGLEPNGSWHLFVFDDALENSGSINAGWSLTITSTELQPVLSIVPMGQFVQVSWPATAVGFGLEGAENLAAPAWSAVTNAVTVTDGQNRVTIPVDRAERFFRLRR
jgi:hypothetical protein